MSNYFTDEQADAIESQHKPHVLKAKDGYVTFQDNVFENTVLIRMFRVEKGEDNDIVCGEIKRKTMDKEEARELYKSLIKKGYVKE